METIGRVEGVFGVGGFVSSAAQKSWVGRWARD